MINALLDPDILFISDNDWQDNEKKSLFLEHLLTNLNTLDKYNVAQIFWNDELEYIVWSDPQLPPWRYYYANQLVPILYKTLHHRTLPTEINTANCCTSTPILNCSHQAALLCFLKIVHQIKAEQANALLCLGLNNILPTNLQYIFSCKCCQQNFTPQLIKHSTDWLNHIDCTFDFWPVSVYDIKLFKEGLNIIRIRDFKDIPFLYNFDFSQQFMRDITDSCSNKEKTLNQIVKRLTKTLQQVTRDSSLKDEYISKTKIRERRFRIVEDIRVHYNYVGDKELLFLHYYDKGHHEDGL